MAAVPKRKLTVAEYYAIETAAEFKSEFYDGALYPIRETAGVRDGRVVAMAGAGIPHNRVKENAAIRIGSLIEGGPCDSYSSEQRVRVEATGLVTYPDIFVVCGPVQTDPQNADTVLNPAVIIEVLSPSTEAFDRGKKFLNYKLIPALKEYVLIAQDAPTVERFVRAADGTWIHTAFTGPDATWRIETLGLEIPLSTVFCGVQLSDPHGPPSDPKDQATALGLTVFRAVPEA